MYAMIDDLGIPQAIINITKKVELSLTTEAKGNLTYE
jgi:hypothetical protein